MIARIFTMTTFPGREAELEEKLNSISTAVFDSHPGIIEYRIGRQTGSGNRREYTLYSLWPDIDALKEMTGEEWEQPYIPDVIKPLVESVRVNHYEVFASGPEKGNST